MNSKRSARPHLRPLPRSFYDRDVLAVAQELIGVLLVRRAEDGLCAGRIVEAEAYLAAGDSASHSFAGRKNKNASMFGPPGHAYVYPIHSRVCFNVVTEPAGVGSAVLIRAVEPVDGVPLMQNRRGCERLRDLARGPARLCEAFAITRALDGWDLTTGDALWLAKDETDSPQELPIERTTRIGVTSAHDLPLRFILAGSPFVSGARPADLRSSERA
ncbi:MAG: DNA-3-methyladenine glycosylase [Phycisphaerae bacterium]|jgi:DNA-3-methyladenine glycosylase